MTLSEVFRLAAYYCVSMANSYAGDWTEGQSVQERKWDAKQKKVSKLAAELGISMRSPTKPTKPTAPKKRISMDDYGLDIPS